MSNSKSRKTEETENRIKANLEGLMAENFSKQKKDIKPEIQEVLERTSLVVQWLRICLPMQGTQVQTLVQEDPTCRGATKPVCHNY